MTDTLLYCVIEVMRRSWHYLYESKINLPEKMFLRFSTAAASWLCWTTASLTSFRFSMVLMLCLQSLLTSANEFWMSLTSSRALCSCVSPVRTPSNWDWMAAWKKHWHTDITAVLIFVIIHPCAHYKYCDYTYIFGIHIIILKILDRNSGLDKQHQISDVMQTNTAAWLKYYLNTV